MYGIVMPSDAGVTVRVITNMHISDYFSSILGVRKS